jgi:TIR domain
MPAPVIFISHSHKDTSFVTALQRTLATYGVDTWVDRNKLIGGEAWPQGLRSAIEHCDAFILVLSPSALASKMVREEYQLAQSLGKRIFPVLYKRVRRPPEEIRDLHWFDASRQGLRGLLDLVYTLDTLGLLPVPTPESFDSSLVIARAMRGDIPPGWVVTRANPAWYRRRMFAHTLVGLLLLALALFTSIVISASQAHPAVQALLYLVLGWCFVNSESYCFFRRAFYARSLRGDVAPEMVVATPAGFAISQRRFWGIVVFRAMGYNFAGASQLDARTVRRRRGALIMRARSTGSSYKVVLPRQFGETDHLARQIAAQYAQFSQKKQGTAPLKVNPPSPVSS